MILDKLNLFIESQINEKHGNHSLQRQVLYSANFDFRPFRVECLELEKSIWSKLDFFGFLN